MPLQFLAATIAGFVLMCTVTPFDRLRTKMMAPKDESTKRDMSLIQHAEDIFDKDGYSGFYKGSYAFWANNGPKKCLQFLAFEHLQKIIRSKKRDW